VTSYYEENWGFCLSQDQRDKLTDDFYKVYIDSKLFKGELNYAELLVQGKSTKEIVFSTYICHPSMANNELSGIVLANALIKYVKELNNSYYSYRFLFLPETIGSIAYINFNLPALKKNVTSGFILTCVGNEAEFSFMPSRTSNTYADKVAKFLLHNYYPNYKEYTFLDRGSDERQFCSPKVNLPFVSIMKSKYKEFKEYHTSLDNLSFITPNALGESYDLYTKIINIIESNFKLMSNVFCEPMLSRRGLYPNIGGQLKNSETKLIKDIIALSDGNLDLIDLSNILKVDYFLLKEKVDLLIDLNLIKKIIN
jgi:aminopeptidase-like protein